jgi:uncharacterized protein DUF6065
MAMGPGRGYQWTEDPMSDNFNERPLTAFIISDTPPPVSPAPLNRTWMAATRRGWANRCLPMLIANQSGWVVHNPCAFSATWLGAEGRTGVMINPDKRKSGQFLPSSHFGYGILTWHLPFLFRTPPGYNLLVRGPANYPKDAVYPLEGVVETDWSAASFTMNWKLTRKLMPVRFEVDEPICMIVPQRRGELEAFTPELRHIDSDEELRRKHEIFIRSRDELGQVQATTDSAAAARLPWQGDYTRGTTTDGESGPQDHQTRRHLRSFIDRQHETQ